MLLIAFGSEGGEGEVSFQSAHFVQQCIKSINPNQEIELAQVTAANFEEIIEKYKPTCVFNAMHGAFGEDGGLQNLLDFHNIPYTHSGARASFIGMNKILSKSIMGRMGVPFAKGISFSSKELFSGKAVQLIEEGVKEGKLKGSRFIIKPSNMGSSLYVLELNLNKKHQFADEVDALSKAQNVTEGKVCPSMYIAEEMCTGRELDVVVFDATEGDPIVGVAEIIGTGEIYTYEKKYHSQSSVVNFNPNLKEEIRQELCRYGLAMHKGIGCRGVTRSEFILEEKEDGTHKICALEINTHPGLRKTSCAIKVPSIVANKTPEEIVLALLKQASFSK